MLQIQPFDRLGHPLRVAQWPAALDGCLDGGLFGGALRGVDEVEPAAVAGVGSVGPGGEDGLLFRGAVEAAPQAAVLPVVGAGHQFCAEGVAIDVAAYVPGVLKGREPRLDGKGLEPALVERPGAGGVVVGVPALHMGDLQPAHEFREHGGLALAWPEDQVEMIGHDHVGEQAQGNAGVGFFQDALEGEVVVGFLENGGPARGTVDDVIDGVVLEGAGLARHGRSISSRTGNANNDSRPLFSDWA